MIRTEEISMGSDDGQSDSERRLAEERRSGTDTRSELEKRLIGERRSGGDRRQDQGERPVVAQPTDAQLALFARRLRRALRNEKGRESSASRAARMISLFIPRCSRRWNGSKASLARQPRRSRSPQLLATSFCEKPRPAVIFERLRSRRWRRGKRTVVNGIDRGVGARGALATFHLRSDERLPPTRT